MGRNGPGYRIEDLWEARGAQSGARWRVWLWRPAVGRYRRVHKDGLYGEVEAWAKDQAAAQRVHRATDVAVTLSAVGKEYCQLLDDGRRAATHVAQVKRVVAQFVAAGIEDLQAPDLFLRVRAAWKAMRARPTEGQALQLAALEVLATARGAVPARAVWEGVNRGRATPVPYRTLLSVLRALARGGHVRIDASAMVHRFAALRAPQALADSFPARSPVTLNRYIGHLEAILRYAVAQGLLQRDPLAQLKHEPEPERPKAVFRLAELRRLLAHRAHPYHLVFALMLYTGCRTGEARHLRWEDVDWDAARLDVRIQEGYRLKRQKERRPPLLTELRQILEPLRPKPPEREEGFIIADAALREADAKTDWLRFRAFLEDAGVPAGARSRHSTRHTWVSLQLATGQDLYFVKRWAGHEDTATTEGYAAAADDYRDQVADWPKGQFRLLGPVSVVGVA